MSRKEEVEGELKQNRAKDTERRKEKMKEGKTKDKKKKRQKPIKKS